MGNYDLNYKSTDPNKRFALSCFHSHNRHAFIMGKRRENHSYVDWKFNSTELKSSVKGFDIGKQLGRKDFQNVNFDR